jgi:chromosome segregation ATPase
MEIDLRSADVLQAEIQRLKEILELKMREIDDYKSRLSKCELFLTESGQLSGQVRESEQKIQRLCAEMEKMSQTIIQKNEEIQVLRVKHQQIEASRRDEELLKQEISRIRDILERKLSEIDQLKSRNAELELLLSQEGQNGGIIREWQGKAELCGKQVERLTEILKQKLNELEEWRLRYSRLETSLRERETIEAEITKLKEILGGKMREIDELKGQNANLEVILGENRVLREKLGEGERRIAAVGKEMENLGNALKEKVEEVDELRLRLTRQEGGMRDNEVVQREMVRMKVKFLEENSIF